MFKILVIVVTVLSFCHAKEFRFDYDYNDDAEGWLKFHIIPGTWREARMRCHAEGAVLASPLSEQLKKAIIAIVQQHKNNTSPIRIFTGIHATFSKGDYTSIEGKPLTRLPITWAPGEPDNNENAESCLAMFADSHGSISDVRCDLVLPYVCYKEFAKLTMTECGTDPAYQLEPRTGSCYKFHQRALAWSQAFMTCQSEGGYLVIINNEVEHEIVRNLFSKYPASTIKAVEPGIMGIGFHDWGERMTFLTIHGETLEKAGYQKWSGGQPNNTTRTQSNDFGQSCGTVYRDGLLNDMWCNVPVPFLCEMNPRSLFFLPHEK